MFLNLLFHPHSEMSAALFTTSGSTASLSLVLSIRYSVRTLRVESVIPCNKKSNLQHELLRCFWATWQSRKKLPYVRFFKFFFLACCTSCKSAMFFCVFVFFCSFYKFFFIAHTGNNWYYFCAFTFLQCKIYVK